jgi:AraC-like DNA-binding protein
VVSGAVDGQEHLDMAYGEAEELLTDLFYSGWNCYLTLSDKRIYRLQEHALEKENEEVLVGLLSSSRTQESLHELKRVIDSAEQRGVHPKKLKQAVTMLLLRSVQPNKSDGAKPSHFGEAVSLLQKCLTREDFMAQLAAFLHDFADNTPPSAYSAEVSKGITFMERHMGEKITLARLAEVTHLHPNYFATLFKEQTGQTPMGYLMELRMNRAKERLRHSNLYIQEIAEQVGFTNLSHFSRLFKQMTGQSPSEYRQ